MATTEYYQGVVSFIENASETKKVKLSISETDHGLLIRIADNLYKASETELTVFAPPDEAKKIGDAICNAIGLYRDCRENNRR